MSHAIEALEARRDCRHEGVFSPDEYPAFNADVLFRICNHAALEMVSEPVMFVSTATARILHANRAACRRLGCSPSQLRNVLVEDFVVDATSQNLEEISRRVANSTRQEAQVRAVLRHQNGALIPIRCRVRAIRVDEDEVLLVMAKGNCCLRNAEDRKTPNAISDSLTRLPNREWLWNQLEAEVEAAQSGNYQFAVLFVDIDRFKSINDSYGHLAGDQVLQAVARHLLASVRPADSVARFGGDEFVVVLKHIRGEDDVRGIVTRIARGVEGAGGRRGDSEALSRVTVSIGVAICGADSSPVAAIEQADRAMYRAKAMGRSGRFAVDDSLSLSFDRWESVGVVDRKRQVG